jgi:outer membrane protein assembly factor BamB
VKLHLSLLLVFLVVGCMAQKPPPSQPQDWEYQTDGSIVTPPVLKEGRLYVFSLDGYLYCFDAMNGKIKWKTNVGNFYIDKLTLGNDSIFIRYFHHLDEENPMTGYSWDYELLAFDQDSGKEKWKLTFDNRIESMVASDDVYITTNEELMRINRKNGEIEWRAKLGVTYDRQVMDYFEEKIFVESELNTVACYSDNGEELWELREQNEPYYRYAPQILHENGTLLISMRKIYKVDIQSGEILWSFDNLDHYYFDPEILNENIYFSVREPDETQSLVCFDLETGEILWEKSMPDSHDSVTRILTHNQNSYQYMYEDYDFSPYLLPQKATIAHAADGEPFFEYKEPFIAFAGNEEMIIFSVENGLVCYDIMTGKKIWEYSDDLYIFLNIFIEGEQVFITSDNGKVYCFSINGDFPFRKPEKKVDYSGELGEISKMNVSWFISYDLGDLYQGEAHLSFDGDSYIVTSGFEDGLSFRKGKFKTDLIGKKINRQLIEEFYVSITDLYVDSEHDGPESTCWADITIELQLENGEWVIINGGHDIENFAPWEIQFRDCRAMQYSGKLTIPFKAIMKDVGWSYNSSNNLEFYKAVSKGLRQQPLTLLEICKSPKRKKMIV